jgi:hypothetical protein
MIDLLSRKTASGDLDVNLALHHLANHEWGLARTAIENGLAKGGLSEPNMAGILLQDIYARLGINPARRLESSAPGRQQKTPWR